MFLFVFAELISIFSYFTFHLTTITSLMDLGGEPNSIEVRMGLIADFLGTCLSINDLCSKFLVFTLELSKINKVLKLVYICVPLSSGQHLL